VGINIPRMVSLFQTGQEVMVESECYVRTQIAMVRAAAILFQFEASEKKHGVKHFLCVL